MDKANKYVTPKTAGLMPEDARALCVGCGACASIAGLQMAEDKHGFYRPPVEAVDDKCSRYCPVATLPTKYSENPWGETVSSYLGWATDDEVRSNASSGGAITACLCYLLNRGLVDAVMQVGPDARDPLFSEVRFNRTVDEVKECSGSRYVSCPALSCVSEAVASGKRFAAVGKPCDIRALRILVDSDERYAEAFPYLFSFFCAGLPSKNAARRLDERLNPEGKKMVAFRYRGNGWPGYATESFEGGGEARMTYDNSWGKILGRDLEGYCRFCFDGLGEYADVSAGDAWYRLPNGKPDFSEHEGRNIVFGRTKKGDDLLQAMAGCGLLHLEDFDDWNYLRGIQARQFERKATLATNLRVLRLTCHKTMTANLAELGRYSKALSLKERLLYAKGLLGRIVKGKISVP